MAETRQKAAMEHYLTNDLQQVLMRLLGYSGGTKQLSTRPISIHKKSLLEIDHNTIGNSMALQRSRFVIIDNDVSNKRLRQLSQS